jgi:hypothetical protein
MKLANRIALSGDTPKKIEISKLGNAIEAA